MKTSRQCLECIRKDVLAAGTWLLPRDKYGMLEARVNRVLEKADRNKIPSYYITKVHRCLKSLSPKMGKLMEQRRQANQMVKKMLARFGRGSLEEKLRWAVWANFLDFRTAGVGYRYDNFKALARRLDRRLHVDERDRIIDAVRGAKKILYVLDNVGEIGFDRLLISAIRAKRKIICAVRGGVMTSDVTREDARYFGLTRSLKVIKSGPDTLGLLREELSGAIRKALLDCDLVIAKGQANYYFFSTYRTLTKAPVVHLFTTKCDLVARQFGRKGKIGIAVLRGRWFHTHNSS